MKHLQKPKISTKDVVIDCAGAYREGTHGGLKAKLISAADIIHQESLSYDFAMQNGDYSCFTTHKIVNGNIAANDMCDTYDNKFVSVSRIRSKYYDKLMATATTGKCPICGIGQVANLDHYLAKSLYPMYALTPVNLTPICRDCNYEKRDVVISSDCAPLHPFYDDVDSLEWLCADISLSDDSLVATYYVNAELSDSNPMLYERLVEHLKLFNLPKAYAIQAASEISENEHLWKTQYERWGKEVFCEYLNDCLVSREKMQRNTWYTALMRALIKHITQIIQKDCF